MATIDKDLAERLVEKLKGQTRPQMYCVVSYRNKMTSEVNYAYCEAEVHFQAILKSQVTEYIQILWASERFKKNHILAEIEGFAPIGLVDRLRNIRWRQINDSEGGELFPGISLAGRHLVKNGGSEDFPLLVTITENNNGDRFEVKGRVFITIAKKIRERNQNLLLGHVLSDQEGSGLSRYTICIFGSEKFTNPLAGGN